MKILIALSLFSAMLLASCQQQPAQPQALSPEQLAQIKGTLAPAANGACPYHSHQLMDTAKVVLTSLQGVKKGYALTPFVVKTFNKQPTDVAPVQFVDEGFKPIDSATAKKIVDIKKFNW